MNGYFYLNGEAVSAGAAGVFADDIGLWRGYGVFEVIRTFGGRPFLLDKHAERLQKSSARLNIDLPYRLDEMESAIKEILAKNLPAGRQDLPRPEATIRIVLTGGRLINGLEYDPRRPNFLIWASDFTPPDKKILSEGIKLVTTEYQRILPEIKTLNYTVAVREWPRVKKAGATELLYTWRGRVSEASTSNFFLVKAGTLVTPKEDVLLGTTRNLVIELARGEFAVEEREVKIEELVSAEEAFITATNKDIMPVVRIDNNTIGNGAVGPVTRRLIELFYQYVSSYF